MPQFNRHWQVAKKLTPEDERELLIYPPVLRQLLFNRGILSSEAAQQYLHPSPLSGAYPTMLGLPEAVDRLVQAIQLSEPIAIYGDYDADGVTATALLVEALTAMNAKVRGYIPNRFDEGYGLNNEALDALCSEGFRVVVTVDCGIRSPKEAAYARSLGLDLIITDHHYPEAELPAAVAIVNPTQPGDPYPEKHLAGVGLAYKLAAALAERLTQDGISLNGFAPENLLDLVALGTVADLAPLVGENRYLVRAGIESMRHCKRQGLLSLINVTAINQSRLCASDIGYILGPRLNAAGRLESALAALNLLITTSVNEAGYLAQQLDNQNRERQRITQEIQRQAEEIALAGNPDAMLLFAAHEDFNPGVVGLAASRLTELYYRPSIVAYKGEEFTRASCRSIPEFHITEALDQCAELLVRHGGHAAAAGFTVTNENLPLLVERMYFLAAEQLDGKDLSPIFKADLEIPLSQLKPSLLEIIEMLQPTGFKNHQAVFVSRGLEVTKCRVVGRDNAHLKLTVKEGGLVFDAIAFRQGYWYEQIPSHIDLMYTFELNEFNGRSSLQLNVRDLKPAGIPD
jgi:single-stranded-DNA-specific exonuclease